MIEQEVGFAFYVIFTGVCSISWILTVLHRTFVNFTIVFYENINLCTRELAQNSWNRAHPWEYKYVHALGVYGNDLPWSSNAGPQGCARFPEFWLFCIEQVWNLPLYCFGNINLCTHVLTQNSWTRAHPTSYSTNNDFLLLFKPLLIFVKWGPCYLNPMRMHMHGCARFA